MKIKHDTVEYYIDDAIVELKKVLTGCKNKSLSDSELLPHMEHSLHMLNAAYNFRYKSRDEIAKLSQSEWEKNLIPPKEIF